MASSIGALTNAPTDPGAPRRDPRAGGRGELVVKRSDKLGDVSRRSFLWSESVCLILCLSCFCGSLCVFTRGRTDEFQWTTRDGPQVITQHNYQVFRYVQLTFLDGPPPSDLTVSAWGVAYDWEEGESAFVSSNQTLNHVWRLCANTLRFGVLGEHPCKIRHLPLDCHCNSGVNSQY